jgi:hypothetical protein
MQMLQQQKITTKTTTTNTSTTKTNYSYHNRGILTVGLVRLG